MTNEELKKKIVEVVLNSEITGIQIRAITGGYSMANNIADALIAANIGDVTAHEAEAEYWEKICKSESDEYHITVKNAAEHARHLMQERDEYKHRAEVAERAVRFICDKAMKNHDIIVFPEDGTQTKNEAELFTYCIERAERELAEEEDDDRRI